MPYTYNPSQKFDSMKISLLRDIIKIFKKSIILKVSTKIILHNNIFDKLLINWYKKNYCPLNNEVTHPFIITKKFIDFFFNSIRFFWFFFSNFVKWTKRYEFRIRFYKFWYGSQIFGLLLVQSIFMVIPLIFFPKMVTLKT